MNIDLIKKIRELVDLGHDEASFNMTAFFKPTYKETEFPDDPLERCGTAMCLAGWTLLAADITMSNIQTLGLEARIAISEVIEEEAAKLLHLTNQERSALFFANTHEHTNWNLEDITKPWALAMLDNLIATGDIDWEGTRP